MTISKFKLSPRYFNFKEVTISPPWDYLYMNDINITRLRVVTSSSNINKKIHNKHAHAEFKEY